MIPLVIYGLVAGDDVTAAEGTLQPGASPIWNRVTASRNYNYGLLLRFVCAHKHEMIKIPKLIIYSHWEQKRSINHK